MSIANTLNGKADRRDYFEVSANSGAIRFTFPHARLLVVDDIATNLKVAEGLLAPYRAVVDTCLNGLQAIEFVKRNEYDIVFMDHMMPEMDGIEVVAAIRALEGERFRTVPIIALTANAVVGMREMFIENGFNDFLAKPIDVSKLDEMLDLWIPKEKREKSNEQKNEGQDKLPDKDVHSSFPVIPGVDTEKGIAMTGGTLTAYKQVLSLFRKDAQDRLPLLQKAPDTDTLPSFVTNVHALKSASASLGAGEISAKAAELETAGKAKDMSFIHKHLPAFAQQLAELVKNIHAAIDITEDERIPSDTNNGADISAYIPIFREFAEALKSQNAAEIDRILEELNQKTFDSKTKETIEKISDDVLMTEFDNALRKIEGLLSA
jgi:CheY-like chemotaxis protein